VVRSQGQVRVTGRPCTKTQVVDDDVRVRAALCALLANAGGFRCRAVDNQQATHLLLGDASDFDVAVVDMSVAADSEAQATILALLAPVVVSMSGAVRSVAMAAGAAAFVEKDGDAATLVAVLHEVASGRAGGTAPR